MDIKDGLDFYLKIIPALSSPGWEYTDKPSFHDVIAWHRLNISDPDIGIRGRMGIRDTGTRIYCFVQLESGEGDRPAFLVIAPLQLALLGSLGKLIILPTFEVLEAEALRVAHDLITEKKAGWIEKQNDWLEQTNAMK